MIYAIHDTGESYFSSFFLDICSQSISSLGCKASCIVINFLIFWFIFWVPPWSILRMVQSILQGRLPRCLPLWQDFCYWAWFRVVFSFFWDFSSFLLSYLFVWQCLLLVLPSTRNFPSLQAFWFFLDLDVLSLSLFLFSYFSIWGWHIFDPKPRSNILALYILFFFLQFFFFFFLKISL